MKTFIPFFFKATNIEAGLDSTVTWQVSVALDIQMQVTLLSVVKGLSVVAHLKELC